MSSCNNTNLEINAIIEVAIETTITIYGLASNLSHIQDIGRLASIIIEIII